MANHMIWLLRSRGKLWEGRWQKSDIESDGDKDSELEGAEGGLSLRHCLHLNVYST